MIRAVEPGEHTSVPTPRAGNERALPCLWFTRLPLVDLFHLLRERHFPRVRRELQVQFALQERLFELDDDGVAARASFHQVLNHRETPVEVFGTFLKRALDDLDPLASEGEAARGLAFRELCPEEGFAEEWLDLNLASCLKHRQGESGVTVLARWQELWLKGRSLSPTLVVKRRTAERELRRLLQRRT